MTSYSTTESGLELNVPNRKKPNSAISEWERKGCLNSGAAFLIYQRENVAQRESMDEIFPRNRENLLGPQLITINSYTFLFQRPLWLNHYKIWPITLKEVSWLYLIKTCSLSYLIYCHTPTFTPIYYFYIQRRTEWGVRRKIRWPKTAAHHGCLDW